jgi:Ring finger domain
VVKEVDFCFETSEPFSAQDFDENAKDGDDLVNDPNGPIQYSDCGTTPASKSDHSYDIESVNHVKEKDSDEFAPRSLRIGSSQRRVPNCCAICLCPYEARETIVWSSRRLCNHAFHLDCMMDWLTKMRDGTPCPCCRQEFTDLPIITKKAEHVRTRQLVPARAFDPRAIVFR